MKQQPPVRKNQELALTVDGMGANGEGVAHLDGGFTVFVRDALPGEEIVGQVDIVKNSYAVADIKSITKKSGHRITPACPLFGKCGGCQTAHIDYAAELELKRQRVIDALERIGGQKNAVVPEMLAGEPTHYRNKMQFPVGRRNGEIIIGCYERGTHSVTKTDDCLIQMPGNNDVLRLLTELVRKFAVEPYDEKKGSGVLRHIVGREGMDGRLMIVFVTRGEHLPRQQEIVQEIVRRLPQVKSIWQNINGAKNNVIMGKRGRLLWGEPTITEKIAGLLFQISPLSFFQVNTRQAERLYEIALEFAAPGGNEVVIDAYCGTGTIALFFARRAKRVIGIEIVAAAVEDAKKNAALNSIENAEFICGDAAKIMERYAKQKFVADVIVLDPPRAGCAPEMLDAAAAVNPRCIVYVSCNPATLARDSAHLSADGFIMTRVQCVDMFPRTVHVETVALFAKP